MRIFVCKDRYENIMTCIYDAWEWSLKNGHENMKIMKEPIIQPSLFDEYVYIDEDKEKSLAEAPEGSLRLCQHGDKIQYYHRNNPKDFNGVYIKEKDRELAKQLAQKDYDKKVLTCAEKELNAIDKFFLNCKSFSNLGFSIIFVTSFVNIISSFIFCCKCNKALGRI